MGTYGNGKAKATKTGASPLFWRNNKGPALLSDWKDIDAELLSDFIARVTVGGAGVILSLTSDHGAFSITVLMDDEKVREYPVGKLECEDTLRSIRDYFS